MASLDLPTDAADVILPPTIEETGRVTLPAALFRRAMERVVHAGHEDAGRPLWGVNLRCTATVLAAEASDSYRFARAIEQVHAQRFAAMLNRRFVSKLLATLRAATTIAVVQGANHVVADIGHLRVIGSAPQVPFPGLGTTMDGASAWSCELELENLLAAVEMLCVVDEAADLRLEFGPAKLRLSVRSPDGEAAFPLSCDGAGAAGERSVSLRNFRAACQSLGTPKASLSVADEPHPVVRLDGGDEGSGVRWVLATRSE